MQKVAFSYLLSLDSNINNWDDFVNFFKHNLSYEDQKHLGHIYNTAGEYDENLYLRLMTPKVPLDRRVFSEDIKDLYPEYSHPDYNSHLVELATVKKDLQFAKNPPRKDSDSKKARISDQLYSNPKTFAKHCTHCIYTESKTANVRHKKTDI